jgi:hypothetical protein
LEVGLGVRIQHAVAVGEPDHAIERGVGVGELAPEERMLPAPHSPPSD